MGGLELAPDPQRQSFLAFPRTDAPIFFLYYPLHMIFYLNLCQTLNKFSWADSLIIKSIIRSVIFVSIAINERCKIRLLLIFQRLS